MVYNIESAVERLVEARKAYYGTGHAIMTDEEYDSLEDMVRKHDPDHPFFDTVGHPASSAWKKAGHGIFMGSLDKVHTREDFLKWVSKFEKDTLFCLQFKLDGLSISLDYKDSEFMKAITRGNGIEGEEISQNVAFMRGFRKKAMPVTGEALKDMSDAGMIDIMKPAEYPGFFFTGSVRAEILLSKNDFNRINQVLPKEKKYSNPRNAAAGISRRYDGKFSKYLQIVTYDINRAIDEPDKIKTLKKLGFYTPVQFIGNPEKIITAYESIERSRKTLSYDIDGVVVKVCSQEIQKAMGMTRNKPKAQKAWKFEPPGSATIFHKEIWDVGRTGVVTPLANLEPVEIEGSIIRKATLHNVAEIKRLGIGRGDTVMLVKRGDIIPKIEAVLKHEGNPIKIPTECPSCGLKLENDGTTLRCLNDDCSRKIFFRILNWIKVTEIDTFGQSLAQELYDMGTLNSIADIYRLKSSHISSIERWGEKSAKKIIDNIIKTKNMSSEKFLCALGIPSISESTSAELLQAFETIDNLMERSVEDIVKLKGFSDISASKVVAGLLKNKEEINFLLTIISLQVEGNEETLIVPFFLRVLGGISFCFTGTMEKPRSYYQAIVTQLGGTNKKSIVRGLSYLVCNEDKRSNKSVKAEKYGVKVITEKEFLKIAGNYTPEKEPEEKLEPEQGLVEDCGTLFNEE